MKRFVLVVIALASVSFLFGRAADIGIGSSLLCLFPIMYVAFNFFVTVLAGVKGYADKQKLTETELAAYDILVNKTSSDVEIISALAVLHGVNLEATRNALVTCYVRKHGNNMLREMIYMVIKNNFGTDYAESCKKSRHSFLARIIAS